jgi:hypothetical protein
VGLRGFACQHVGVGRWYEGRKSPQLLGFSCSVCFPGLFVRRRRLLPDSRPRLPACPSAGRRAASLAGRSPPGYAGSSPVPFVFLLSLPASPRNLGAFDPWVALFGASGAVLGCQRWPPFPSLR